MENERHGKCWGNEVKNILMDESVVDVPMTFVSENDGVRDSTPWNRIILEL